MIIGHDIPANKQAGHGPVRLMWYSSGNRWIEPGTPIATVKDLAQPTIKAALNEALRRQGDPAFVGACIYSSGEPVISCREIEVFAREPLELAANLAGLIKEDLNAGPVELCSFPTRDADIPRIVFSTLREAFGLYAGAGIGIVEAYIANSTADAILIRPSVLNAVVEYLR